MSSNMTSRLANKFRPASMILVLIAALQYVSESKVPPDPKSSQQQKWRRALESPYGDDLTKCKSSWKSISRRNDAAEIAPCLAKLLFAAAPRLYDAAGIPALDIPTFAPLAVPEDTPIGQQTVFYGQIHAGAVLTDVAEGLTPQHARVEYDPVRKEAQLHVHCPIAVKYNATYRFTINPGALLVGGRQDGAAGTVTEGKVDSVATDVNATLTVRMSESRSGNLWVSSGRSEFQASSLRIRFTGRTSQDAPFANLLNSIVAPTEAGLVLLEELKPNINKILARCLGSLFHGGWKHLDKL